MKSTERYADTWLRTIAKECGQKCPDDWCDAIMNLCAWLEHGYKKSGSYRRGKWLREICGYSKKNRKKPLDKTGTP